MLGKVRVASLSPRSSPSPAAAPPPSCRSPSASVASYSATPCMPASCCLLLHRCAGDSWLFRSMLMLGKARAARSSHRSSPCPAAAPPPLWFSPTTQPHSAFLLPPPSSVCWRLLAFPVHAYAQKSESGPLFASIFAISCCSSSSFMLLSHVASY